MHKRGNEIDERDTKKESSAVGCVLESVCVCVCTIVKVCVCVCGLLGYSVCVGVLLRDIFNSVCQLLSSPSARDVGGKQKNISNATII